MRIELQARTEQTTPSPRRADLSIEQLRAKLVETEDARARADHLQYLTAALSVAATPEDVAGAVVDRLQRSFRDVAGVVMARRSRSGDGLDLMRAKDMPQEVFEEWRSIPLSAHAPLTDVAREAKAIFLESPDDWRERYPELLPLLTATGHQAQMVAPLIVAGGCVGVIGVAFREPRKFIKEERELLMSVAGQCALALERARLYEAEKEARTAAESANKAKGNFLAAMSHELRTPLNAILGHVDLLALEIYGPTNPQEQDALKRVKRAGQHLLGIIDDLLGFARLESGHVEFHITSVKLRDVVDDLAPIVGPQFAAKNLDYTTQLFEQSIEVEADGGKLTQVLINLLNNAAKFTPPGGRVALETHLGAPSAGGKATVQIIVRDTGIGIPADKLQAVFDPFVQLDASPGARRQGTGLGLAISRDLARGMGGELTVESAPGVSTAFTLSLTKSTGS